MSEIVVPRVNANDDTARLVTWHVDPWQKVKPGDPICSIETTKAAVEVESDAEGYVYPAVEAGTEGRVGELIAWVFAEKSEALLAAARKAREPSVPEGVLVSASAQALMQQHGLTFADFPGRAVISAKEVEAVTLSRAGGLKLEEARAKVETLVGGDDAVLLWGAGYQGAVVLDLLLEAHELRPVAVIDRKSNLTELSGIPTLRPELLEAIAQRGVRRAHVCIGSGREKLEVGATLLNAGFELVNIVHESAVISPSAKLGHNIFAGPQVLVGASAEIGDYCQLNNAASVAHHSLLGKAVQVSDGARIGGLVKIGDGTLVGIGTTVNSRVSVGRWCTLISGATLFADIADHAVLRADGTVVANK